jgi:hypothetical protein
MKATSVAAGATLCLLAACGGSNDSSSGSGSTQGVGNASTGSSSSTSTESTNWSGYVVTGSLGGFSQVAGTWTVPTLSCSSAATDSATWAGIGGYETTDQTLIQAGTEQDCSGGSASYSAWWEGYPLPSASLSSSSYPVNPGDQITVSIDSSLVVLWTIKIEDQTAGWTFSKTTAFVSAGESAEWIEEAPLSIGTSGAGETTLSDFGSVSFSSVEANSKNPALSSSDAIVMVNSSGDVIAQPSGPGSSGDSFDVCYGSGSCD